MAMPKKREYFVLNRNFQGAGGTRYGMVRHLETTFAVKS
jgi:hypothetical protein